MGTFWCLFKRELRACFLSPMAFVVLFCFWAMSGGSFFKLLYDLADGEPLLTSSQRMFGGLISLTLPVIVPLITMRLVAEERKLGTLESLLTTSLRIPELVLAKFFGSLVFFFILWAPVLIYSGVLSRLSPEGVLLPDTGALWAGMFGIMLVGAFYLSVGLLMSSLSSSQIVAAIAGFAILGGGIFSTMFMAYSARSPLMRDLGEYLSAYVHLLDFSRGVVDSRLVILYLSSTALILFFTTRVVSARRI